MNTIKKLVSSLMVVFLFTLLSACGNDSDDNNKIPQAPKAPKTPKTSQPSQNFQIAKSCPSTLDNFFNTQELTSIKEVKELGKGLYFIILKDDSEIKTEDLINALNYNEILEDSSNSTDISSLYSDDDKELMLSTWTPFIKIQRLIQNVNNLQNSWNEYTSFYKGQFEPSIASVINFDVYDLFKPEMTSEESNKKNQLSDLRSYLKTVARVSSASLDPVDINIKQTNEIIESLPKDFNIESHLMLSIQEFNGSCIVDEIKAADTESQDEIELIFNRIISIKKENLDHK